MCTAVFVFTQAELPLELNCWLTGETGWHPEPRTGKACLGNQHKTQACLFGKEPTSKHRHRHRPSSAAQTAREQDWVIEDQNPPRWLCLSLICFQEWQAHEARREIQTRANLLSLKQTRLGNIYINWMHGSLWDLMGGGPLNAEAVGWYNCETTLIFERSWQFREAPQDWRKANVTSILKNGKEEDTRSYR